MKNAEIKSLKEETVNYKAEIIEMTSKIRDKFH